MYRIYETQLSTYIVLFCVPRALFFFTVLGLINGVLTGAGKLYAKTQTLQCPWQLLEWIVSPGDCRDTLVARGANMNLWPL